MKFHRHYYRPCTIIQRHGMDQSKTKKISLEGPCLWKKYRISWLQLIAEIDYKFSITQPYDFFAKEQKWSEGVFIITFIIP